MCFKKPSKITELKAKKAWFLPRHFRAITLFGTVYCNDRKDIDNINTNNYSTKRLVTHETIHVKQAASTHNSWCLFYLLYVWYWIKNLPLALMYSYAPYKLIPFEIEAFVNENKPEYINTDKCEGWKKYKKLKFNEKWTITKRIKYDKDYLRYIF